MEVYDDRRKAPLGVVQTSCQGEEFQKRLALTQQIDRLLAAACEGWERAGGVSQGLSS